MDVGCTGTCVPIGWDEVFEVLRMLATQVLLCLPIGWVEVLEVLQMLDAQVLEVLQMLDAQDAQVLVYLSVGLKCWKFCGCWMHRYFCTYRLG